MFLIGLAIMIGMWIVIIGAARASLRELWAGDETDLCDGCPLASCTGPDGCPLEGR